MGGTECPPSMTVALHPPDPRAASQGWGGGGTKTQMRLLLSTRCPLEDEVPVVVMGGRTH